MQNAILTTLGSFSDQYTATAAKNTSNFNSQWSAAMTAAHDELFKKAWWAGDDALHQFAAALGVDVSVLQSTANPLAATPSPTAATSGAGWVAGATPYGSAANTTGDYLRPIHGKMHGGGPIGSHMGGAWDVPATLQTGEYVVQRRAVQKLGVNLLDTLNNPDTMFHTGGIVDNFGPALTDNFVNKIYNPFMGGNLKFGGKTGYAEMLEILRQKMGGSSFFGGLSGSIPAQFISMFKGLPQGTLDLAQVIFGGDPHAIITATTNGKHVNNSYHYKGQAIDVVGNYRSIWNNLLPLAQNKTLAELFMDLLGGWKDGKNIGAIGGHMDHLHAAVADAFRNGFLAQMGSALKLTNTDTGWLSGLIKLVMMESGGDPHSINPIGLNPRTGGPGLEHAEGLLQMLPSTFMAHELPGHGDIFNPIDNAAAAIDYIKGRYGTVYNTPLFTKGGKYGGYHLGGLVELMNGGKTLSDGIAMLHKGETVVDAPLTRKLEQNMGSGDTNINLHFNAGYFGTDRELEKLVDTIESRIVPKLERAKGMNQRSISSLQQPIPNYGGNKII